jgi:CRP-like cAMP-binding protein
MEPEVFAHLRPHLQLTALKRRAILQEHSRPIEHVHFIERGVASLLARTQRDGPVQVGIVGRLGFVGVAAVLGTKRSPNRCLVEIPGEGFRISTDELRRIMGDVPQVGQRLLHYIHALLIQNTQTALCNVRHDLDKRLCRWLLLASDRLDDTVMPLTHDRLSMILGVRRAGVTTALANLEQAGGVKKTRGAVEIVNRAVLERKTCECYRIVASEYRRLTDSGLYQHVIERSADTRRQPTHDRTSV